MGHVLGTTMWPSLWKSTWLGRGAESGLREERGQEREIAENLDFPSEMNLKPLEDLECHSVLPLSYFILISFTRFVHKDGDLRDLGLTESNSSASVLKRFSCVRLFATPRTVALQAPLSMGFSRQEYWSGLPSPPPGESSRPRDQARVSFTSCLGSSVAISTTWEALNY